MDPLSVDEFVRIVGGTAAPEVLEALPAIRDVSIHSNRITASSAFFALRGSRVDAHDFVPQALDNGAAVAVVETGRGGGALRGRPVVEVGDPLTALQQLAAWWRDRLTARVVAVMGSYGKTITKDALVELLSSGATVYGSHGSLNSTLGTPLAVLACPRDCDYAVIEVAASDPGDVAALTAVVRPDHLVVTGVGGRSLSRFARPADELGEILTIARALPDHGWVLLGSAPAEQVEQATAATGRAPYVANASDQLPTFSETRWTPDGALAQVRLPDGGEGEACIATTSSDVVADVELAASAAWLLGCDGSRLLEALARHSPSSPRIELWRSVGGITLVRSPASSDPVVTGQALRTARILSGAARRTLLVLADRLPELTAPAAAALARVLADEGIDELLGLDCPAHRLVASELEGLVGRHRIALFEGEAALRAHLVGDLRNGDVVLIQSPPQSGISDLASSLSDSMAPTRLSFDVTALEDNVRTLRGLVGPRVRLMGMVKALAYGTDSVNVSLSLQEAGVDQLGVSSADEGAMLRRAGVSIPVLVLLGTAEEMDKMLRHRLTPLVYSGEVLEAVLAAAATAARPVSVHVEVDSGFHRSGFHPEEARRVLRLLHDTPNVAVEGLMTHLSCADDPNEDAHTALQLRRFTEVSEHAEQLGLRGLIRHAAATAAAIRLPQSRFDMVRIGIGLYGLHPSPATRELVSLLPVVGLVSRIVEIIEVAEHERIGYGGTYTVPSGGARIAVVPAGYHDGIPRGISNHGWVLINGIRCPMVGTLSMDSVTVDVSGCPDARVGADVLLYGRHHDQHIPLQDVAAIIGSIPYELMARLGPRVQRIFTRH